MNTNGTVFLPFLLSIIAALWPPLLSALLRLPRNIHRTMNHVQMAGRAALVSPAFSRNRRSHCSLWSSAGSRDYTLTLHMPCWLCALDIFSCCSILARFFHLLWHEVIFFFRQVETWWEEKKMWGRSKWNLLLPKQRTHLPWCLIHRQLICLTGAERFGWLDVQDLRKKFCLLCVNTFRLSDQLSHFQVKKTTGFCTVSNRLYSVIMFILLFVSALKQSETTAQRQCRVCCWVRNLFDLHAQKVPTHNFETSLL